MTLSTPTTWDPARDRRGRGLGASPEALHEIDAIGRSRTVARAGIRFDYPAAANILAMFEMLTTLGYE